MAGKLKRSATLWSSAVLCLILWSGLAGASCLKDYDRADYPHWGPSVNYSDIRQEVIAGAVVADLSVIGGRVVGGLWHDPFSGQNYRIKDVTPDVDHLVSLAWAHSRGGACMTRDQRRALANDPENLWPVHPSANRQKGANVSGWLPANLGICTRYLRQLKRVIKKHNLKTEPDDLGAHGVLVKKCVDWRNGIKIEKARKWYQGWLNE